MGIQANNEVSVPKAVLREIKKIPGEIVTGTKAVIAGFCGMGIDTIGGAYVSSTHLKRRVKETYAKLFDDDDKPALLKMPLAALPPFVGVAKVILQGISGIFTGLGKGIGDVLDVDGVGSDSIKESIQNRFNDLEKLNKDLNDEVGIISGWHETPKEKRDWERHEAYYRARRSC